jgi:hypothetical protein
MAIYLHFRMRASYDARPRGGSFLRAYLWFCAAAGPDILIRLKGGGRRRGYQLPTHRTFGRSGALVSTPEQVTAKEQLELAKLRLEIRNINRTFYAQIANTACIFFLGLTVLYFYQWPQLQQSEAARLSAEELQVAKLVEDTQGNIKDPADKTRMLEAIARRWPQYPFTSDIAAAQHSGQQVSTQTPIADDSDLPDETRENNKCTYLSRQIQDLQFSMQKLTDDANSQVRVTGSRPVGQGPIWRAIQTQIEDTKVRLDAAKLRYETECPSHARSSGWRR